MRPPQDSYFVRLDVGPPPPAAPATGGRRQSVARDPFEPADPPRRKRRRRGRARPKLLLILAVILGAWFVWATQQPGGVSGAVNSWIDHVRGDVASMSTDPAVRNASRYMNEQYAATHAYPRVSDDELTAAGFGVGVSSEWCSPQAVVLHGTAGAGSISRLLVGGRDLGSVDGAQGCPTNLDDPAPWHAPSH